MASDKPKPTTAGKLIPIRRGTEGKPHFIDAERSVLGCMLLEPKTIPVAIGLGLGASDFCVGVHVYIYEAIIQVFNSGMVPGIIEVGNELGIKRRYEAVGGRIALDELEHSVLTTAMFRQHVKVVMDEAMKRKASKACGRASVEIERSTDGVGETMDRVRGIIMEGMEPRTESETIGASEIVEREVARIERVVTGQVQPFALTTGYSGLERIPLVIEPGKTVILAGRPSVGKTAFALNLMLRFSERQDAGNVFFSLDDGERSAARRMLMIAGNGKIDSSVFRGEASKESMELLIAAQARLFTVGDNILGDYSSRMSTTGIHAGLLVAKQRNPKIKAFFVDYLSLVSPAVEKKGETRAQEVARTIQEIKAIGKKLDLAAFVLCQLGRDYAKGKKEDAEPQLHHLRESGAIEQDADVVIFLYSPGSDGGEADESTVAVKVAKNKDGRLGHCSLTFRKRYQIFDDPERAGDATANLKYWNE